MENNFLLKTKPLRNPGQSLDDQIVNLIYDKLLFYVLLPCVVWAFAASEWLAQVRRAPRMPAVYAGFAAALTVFGTIRFWQIWQRLKKIKQGRDGERVVGQYLERLREVGVEVFHDVPGKGFNLDHVLIGAKGVFVVETKTWSKPFGKAQIKWDGARILVSGRTPDRDPVAQAAAQVRWLRQLLEESTGKQFPVRGVVVFPGWFINRLDSAKGSAIWVLAPKELPGWIRQEPSTLPDSDVKLAAYHLSQYVVST